MSTLLLTYPNKGRDLKKFIIGILKGWFANKVQRIQYTKTYTIADNAIKQEEEKTLLITYDQDTYEKLIVYIKKNHPHKDVQSFLILNS